MPASPLRRTADDVLHEMLLEDLASRRPHMRSSRLAMVDSLDQLVPDGAVVTHRVDRDDVSDWLFEGEGYRGQLEQHLLGDVYVRVVADAVELAERIVAQMHAKCPEPPADDTLYVTVWNGPGSRYRRQVLASPWAEVARNYPPAVSASLEDLVRLRPASVAGKIVLLHGEPGTGKTTGIRTLLREWREWTRADVVTDGDALLHDPSYLAEVTSQNEGDGWQVIVIEDAGTMVDESSFGGGLSRLLNLTDGIVGAGSRTLFVLTTNERIGALHRSLTRPGRCLANIEFRRFTRREALAWLDGRDDVPPGGATLAELYERTLETTTITNVRQAVTHGVYL